MKKFGHVNRIAFKKINKVSGGASINYGPSFHKGHQANVNIVTDQLAIGDEFTFEKIKEKTVSE
ncbi:hypothetical protein [Virgibacillus kimchii]